MMLCISYRNTTARRDLCSCIWHISHHTQANPADPFQAPDEEVAKCAHIENPDRRVYAGRIK
jgi:hypothetical protein